MKISDKNSGNNYIRLLTYWSPYFRYKEKIEQEILHVSSEKQAMMVMKLSVCNESHMKKNFS